MSTRPLDHYCARCRSALDRWVVDGKNVFMHTPVNIALWVDGHDPEPVPLTEFNRADVVSWCDVDSVPPTWTYTFDFSSVPARLRPEMERYGPDWSLCDPCAVVVQRRDVYALVERAYAPLKGIAARATVVGAILPVYKVLLRQPFRRAPL